jgi:CHAT domain-containing protein
MVCFVICARHRIWLVWFLVCSLVPIAAPAQMIPAADILAWKKATDQPTPQGWTQDQINTLLRLAAAWQQAGNHRLALEAGQKALDLSSSFNSETVAACRSMMGMLSALGRDAETAEQLLAGALDLADRSSSEAIKAEVLNQFGNFRATEGRYADANLLYLLSAQAATKNNDPEAQARAYANGAKIAAYDSRWDESAMLNGLACRCIEQVGAPGQRSSLLICAGQTAQYAAANSGQRHRELLLEAREDYHAAFELAEQLNDSRLESYSLGYLGELYMSDQQCEQALPLLSRAAFYAQAIQAPDALYKWEWDSARAYRALSQTDLAIQQYRHAVQTLQGIRHDVAMSLDNQQRAESFREAGGSVYYELADLLLTQSGTEQDSAQAQRLLGQARETVELMKSAELEDYFRDECCDIARNKTAVVDRVAPGAAVLYVIGLPDRIEILLGISNGLERFTAPVPEAELQQTVRRFRVALEERATEEFLAPAQQLYRWLIRPILPSLESHHVDTIVFVPDGSLRMIPLSALYDGQDFLICKFAVAVTPGLTLMDPKPLQQQRSQILLGGISEAVQGFPRLDCVPEEIERVHSLCGGMILTNKNFLTRRIEDEFQKSAYSIIHIASHAEFNSDARKTFLLTYDGHLDLNALENMIRPSQYHGRPVELLTLSACQTAAGDDRAAMGLAGVALKAGARSALATLWSVNDQAATELVSSFYQQLQSPGVTKAKALRLAQMRLLSGGASLAHATDENRGVRLSPQELGAQPAVARSPYAHPYYWSAFLLIGNWL